VPDILKIYKLIYLPQYKILILRIKLVKKAGYSFQFFFLGRVEHTPFASKQPMFIYGKSAGNKMDKTVFNLVVPQFDIRNIAIN
jgi:hypothetical protein